MLTLSFVFRLKQCQSTGVTRHLEVPRKFLGVPRDSSQVLKFLEDFRRIVTEKTSDHKVKSREF